VPISEFFAPDMLDTVDAGPQLTGGRFTVTPATQSTGRGLPTPPYTVTMTDTAGNPHAAASDQQFLLSDGGDNGVFVPVVVTIPAGSTSAIFIYSQATPGSYLLGVAPWDGPLASLLPQTVVAVVTQPGVNTGIGGYHMPAASINSPGKVFDIGYLFASMNNPDDVPFATCHKVSLKDTTAFKKLLGPEQLTALAVGASERTITLEAEWATFKLEQLLLGKAGTVSSVTSLPAPTTAPVATPAAGTPPTTYTAGYIAVAYSWVGPYGQTTISPIATVQVTASQQITVTDLGTAMATAGATSINYFMSAQSYPTAAAASGAPLYAATYNSGGATVLPAAYPSLINQSTPILSSTSGTRRILTFSVNDQPVPCRMHYLTPQSGGDLELFFYNCLIPDITIDFTMKDFVVPKLSIECYGDATQPGKPIWAVLTPTSTGI
jgi:hypothetical protein